MCITVCTIKKENSMFWVGKTTEDQCQLFEMGTNMKIKIPKHKTVAPSNFQSLASHLQTCSPTC